MQCPVSFTPYGNGCIHTCPTIHGFEQRTDGGQPKCVYAADQTKMVNLTTVTGIPYNAAAAPPPLPTLEGLKISDPSRYGLFKAEADRVDAALSVLFTTIDKQTQIDNAFKGLLDAENVRDQAPDAYGLARIAYYSLIKGPEWIDSEKARVTKAEVDPEVDRYRSMYRNIASQQDTQRKTQDVMNSVKDGVLSLKDDFQYTTKTFKDQIENLKNQINIERRGREKPDENSSFFTWVDLILNISIIAGLIFAGLTFWRKLSPPTPYTLPSSFIGPRLPYT